MSEAVEKAKDFLERDKAFRLGELMTESSHPKTRTLSQTIQADIAAGIRLLQFVDEDIPLALDRIFAQEAFRRLVEAFGKAFSDGRRIYFTGCGATGRLSILLDAAWRRFWRTAYAECPELLHKAPGMQDRCFSVMAGGDYALIKSVEGFEDYPDFGRCQLSEVGVGANDVVVAITEGGETPFVIGTAWQGLESGANVFFVYNNPTDVLCRHVERSRQVIEEPRIEKLDLATGAMAITGSTRMQAVTTELLVVGAALETALVRWLDDLLPSSVSAKLALYVNSTDDYRRLFAKLLNQLSESQNVLSMARLTQFEENMYRRAGLITYVADSSLLDVLTDTTERSPTFMVPPFRKLGDMNSPVSWAFVKDPFRPTREAWNRMLEREPRGLKWAPPVYKQLNAPTNLQTNPPKLDDAQIYRFQIGNEPDTSRTDATDCALVMVAVGTEADSLSRAALDRLATGFRRTVAITIGPAVCPLDMGEHFHFRCDLPSSPLRLWEHLVVKLILNTISTATMARMGRVVGNAMVWLSPSNKKLIDRGSRLISQVTSCSYEYACQVLHQTMEEVARRSQQGEKVPSPVALAIERISAGTARR
jgi:N-acetylmuramic acid 6-phosphate etherase